MLANAQSYQAAVSKFSWSLPDQCNMAFDVCDYWAEKHPNKTAIIDLTKSKRRDVSYSELRDHADALASTLLERGLKEGDRVGVFRSQSIWTAAAHIAIWKLGMISMPLFTLFGEEALLSRMQDAGAKAIITDQETSDRFSQSFVKLNDLDYVIVPENDVSAAAVSPMPCAHTAPDTPACLIYTSGTTGGPKGALHGHRILRGHLPGVEMSHDLLPKQDDVLWTPADWAWIGGLFDVLMPGLFHGVPVVAARMAKFSAEECQRIIQQGSVRNIFFPPTALRMLKSEGVSIKGLRTIACGGEPLGAEMLHWARDAMGVTINEFYGQTECNMVVSSCNAWFEPKPGAIGKAVPGHEVEIIDDEGKSTMGEGDIAIKRGTAVMMLRYWNNETATRDKFRGDWLLTGDRGMREGEYIRFVGRDDDVITSAGYRIGPAEIEDCMLKHDAVASVGVIGKPDRKRTEIVKAYVQLREGFDASEALEKELQSFVKTRLAAYEYPREISFVDALPMTVTGKIIRKDLKQRAIREMENA